MEKSYIQQADELLLSAMKNPYVSNQMRQLAGMDEYTFWHSVSVARMSIVMGLTYGFGPLELQQLCDAALLHDIGKLEIPEECARTKSSLTVLEQESKKRHPVLGAKRLLADGVMPQDVVEAVFLHHVNYDGSGPQYYEGDPMINPYVGIIRICDVYDHLADDHAYREDVINHKILNVLTASRGKEFDPDMVSLFLFIKERGKLDNHSIQRRVLGQMENFSTHPLGTIAGIPGGKISFSVDLQKRTISSI